MRLEELSGISWVRIKLWEVLSLENAIQRQLVTETLLSEVTQNLFSYIVGYFCVYAPY